MQNIFKYTVVKIITYHKKYKHTEWLLITYIVWLQKQCTLKQVEWLQKQCTLRQVDYGKAAYLDKCATAKTVHYFKNRDKIMYNKHQCRQWWSDWKSSPRKEQHSNTKIKYKNTTQDKKIGGQMLWCGSKPTQQYQSQRY
jgi:hypothetical protein